MKRLAVAAAFVAPAGPALAHGGPGVHDAMVAGLSHPILGADHLLAMVTVGLLAATQGGAARLAMPGTFVLAMGAGLLVGFSGAALPLVEPMILASVFVLGALLALSVRPPVFLGVALAGVFGLFHGMAHGLESGGAALLPFAAGVLATTALLHAAGVALGAVLVTALDSRSGGLPLRFFGAGVSLGGMALLLG